MSKTQGDRLVLAVTGGENSWADEDDLEVRLGSGAVAWLRHLLDGQAICMPAMYPAAGAVRSRTRSPSVRVVVGQIVRDLSSGRWCGPVVIEGDARATFVDPLRLVHRDGCTKCERVWASVAQRLEREPAGTLFRFQRLSGEDLPEGAELATYCQNATASP